MYNIYWARGASIEVWCVAYIFKYPSCGGAKWRRPILVQEAAYSAEFWTKILWRKFIKLDKWMIYGPQCHSVFSIKYSYEKVLLIFVWPTWMIMF